MHLARSRVAAVVVGMAIILSVGAGSAWPCDEVLLRLLANRDHSSDFDARVKALSTQLNDMGFSARQRAWTAADEAFSRVSKTWKDLRSVYLHRPPPAFADDPGWDQQIETMNAVVIKLGDTLRSRNFDVTHEVIKAAQGALVRRYMWQAKGPSERAFDTVNQALTKALEGIDDLDRARGTAELRRQVRHLAQLCRSDAVQRAGLAVNTQLDALENLGRGRVSGAPGSRRAAADRVRVAVAGFRKQFLAEIYFGVR